MLKIYRAGIIGCGFIGVEAPDNHKVAYEQCLQTNLVAFCDIEKDIPNVYRDYMTMVETEKLDIVSVCTPPETHCEIVCDIVPYVKAIYCEKPIALNLKDAQEMIETCHEYKVILQINHQRRFKTPVFRFSRGILNTGTHMFDLLRYLFGKVELLTPNFVVLRGRILCRIEEVNTGEPVFEFDCTHNKDKMITLGVQHLVRCLEMGTRTKSSGEDGFQALKLCLAYKEAKDAEIPAPHN